MQQLLAILASLFALNGNQVVNLDFQAWELGRPTEPELSTYYPAQPFQNAHQIRNYAILSATLDWNPLAAIPTKQDNPEFLRTFCAEFITVPEGPNQIRFFRHYVDAWQTNWTASAVEEGLLKRLSVQLPELASAFVDKLVQNQANVPYLTWYRWRLMMLDRRKEDAYRFAQENHLDTDLACSSVYPLPAQLPVQIQVVWPLPNATEVYTYASAQHTWVPSFVAAPSRSVIRWSTWSRPQKPKYARSWRKGPAWQIMYSRSGNKLTRTAVYLERNSHIEGEIQQGALVEKTVEELQEPRRVSRQAPYLVVIEP